MHHVLCFSEPTISKICFYNLFSGLAATAFSIKVQGSVADIRKKADIKNRLSQRVMVSPQEYSQIMKHREQLHSDGAHYKPRDSIENLFPNTFYLEEVDKLKRRHYAKRN